MNKFILISIIFYSISSLSSTTGTFPGFTGHFGMVVLETNNPDGSQDPGPAILMSQMQVPTENSMLGPGKTIKTADQELTFICALRNSGHTCSIHLKKSSFSSIDPINKKMKFVIQDPELSALFLKPSQESFGFISEDNKFRLKIDSNFFELEFNEH